jgi:hypothetical protein
MPKQLSDIQVREVSLVGKAANQRKYVIMKSADDKTEDKVQAALEILKSATLTDEQKTAVGTLVAPAPKQELLKGDGTVNDAAIAALDPALRGQVEALAKAQATQLAALAELQKSALAERESRERAEYIAKAASEFKAVPGGVEAVGDLLFRVKKSLPEQLPVLESLLKATQAMASDLTKSVGTGDGTASGSAGDTAWERIQKAAGRIAVEKKISEAVAVVQYLDTDEGKALYAEHANETRGK